MPYFWALYCSSLDYLILLKLPTLNLRHEEGDEVRFWYLTKNWIATEHYTLQGSPIFNIPTFKRYAHREMPVHPPLFPAVLRPFAQYENIPHYAVMASWLGHLFAILAVALIGRYLIRYHNLSLSALSPLFWLPLLGIATDPIMTWVSGKLWIDNLHAGLAAMSVALALMANRFRHAQFLDFLILKSLSALPEMIWIKYLLAFKIDFEMSTQGPCPNACLQFDKIKNSSKFRLETQNKISLIINKLINCSPRLDTPYLFCPVRDDNR